jgi:hypothetical protein
MKRAPGPAPDHLVDESLPAERDDRRSPPLLFLFHRRLGVPRQRDEIPDNRNIGHSLGGINIVQPVSTLLAKRNH